jgi:hypothetical protein
MIRRALVGAVLVGVLACFPATASALRSPLLGTHMRLAVVFDGRITLKWKEEVTDSAGCHHSIFEEGMQEYSFGSPRARKTSGWVPGHPRIHGGVLVADGNLRGKHSRTWTILRETQDADCGPVPPRPNDCGNRNLQGVAGGFTIRKGARIPSGPAEGTRAPSDLLLVSLRLNHKPLHTPFRTCPLFYPDGGVDQDVYLDARSLRSLRVGGTRTLRRKGAQTCPGRSRVNERILNGSRGCRVDVELEVDFKRLR